MKEMSRKVEISVYALLSIEIEPRILVAWSVVGYISSSFSRSLIAVEDRLEDERELMVQLRFWYKSYFPFFYWRVFVTYYGILRWVGKITYTCWSRNILLGGSLWYVNKISLVVVLMAKEHYGAISELASWKRVFMDGDEHTQYVF